MTLVDYPLSKTTLDDGATVVTVTVPLDDSLFVPDALPGDDPIPAPDAKLEGPITAKIVGL